MRRNIPRFLLAGTNSGCGKTTVTCAVLQALADRGLKVGAFKCGPDYIDPMFHSRIIGAPCSNLDPFFFAPETMRSLLAENGEGRDVNVIEGVMGYYDGLSLEEPMASTHNAAMATDTPVVLVLGARGASLSLLAQIRGFLDFCPQAPIRGVILNQCSPMSYAGLRDAILRHFGGRVRPLGCLPPVPEAALESRHLGLVTAAEVADLKEKLHLLSLQAEKTLDLDGLLALAREAEPLEACPPELPRLGRARIAVARDKAFCFYYADSLRVLEDLGAELVGFSPLSDPALPEDIQGLYLGGGYPELYAEELSRNESMRLSVRSALEGGLPCIAECGGFMYLTGSIAGKPMAGYLPGDSRDTGKLVRFGYVTLRAKEDNLLCRAGEEIRGHEFHHWDSDHTGDGFRASKPSGRGWDCVFSTPRLYAGYPHFHFRANPEFAVNFYKTCLEVKHEHA